MAMMTAEQYEESLRRLNLVVYIFGKRLGDRPEEERDAHHTTFLKA